MIFWKAAHLKSRLFFYDFFIRIELKGKHEEK